MKKCHSIFLTSDFSKGLINDNHNFNKTKQEELMSRKD